MKITNSLTRGIPTMMISMLCSVAVTSMAIAQTPVPNVQPEAKTPSPAAVTNMVNNCYSCHGPDGQSPGAIPSFKSMNANQIANALKEFKSGARFATVMTRHTKGYSDAELEAIANYIGANQK